jgi:hypothetical protein
MVLGMNEDPEIEEVSKVFCPAGLKFTRGYRLRLPVGPVPINHKQNGYFRHGFKNEVRHWLKANVGETVSHAEWELEGKGDWLFVGSQQASFESQYARQTLVNFLFADKSKAMMFKLVWMGRL